MNCTLKLYFYLLSGETLEKAAEHIMTCFRTCAVDNKSAEEVSKRWGLLNVVNQLFKIYFRVNKVHLSKPLIRAIESSNLKDKYPKSQQVTYKYYVGRKHMFDYDFKAAEEYLTFAFEHFITLRTTERFFPSVDALMIFESPFPTKCFVANVT